MKFGTFFLGQRRDGQYEAEYEEMLQQAEYAEQLGFDQIWVGEHHSSNYGTIPRPPVLLASIAERTQNVELGPLVSVLPFDNPVRVAEDYAMVDVLSGGRLRFGVGRGYQPSEFRNMGAEMETSRETFEEALEIILGLWTNETFSYEGEHYTIPEMSIRPSVVQNPHPPIYVASISDRTFDYVSELGLNCAATVSLTPLEQVKQQLTRARERLLERGMAPRDVDLLFLALANLSEDPQRHRRRIEENVEWYFHKLATLAPGQQHQDIPDSYDEYVEANAGEAPALDDLLEMGSLILDPDVLVDHLEEMQDLFGLRTFVTWHGVGALDDRTVRESMEVMAREVMPHFEEEPATVQS